MNPINSMSESIVRDVGCKFCSEAEDREIRNLQDIVRLGNLLRNSEQAGKIKHEELSAEQKRIRYLERKNDELNNSIRNLDQEIKSLKTKIKMQSSLISQHISERNNIKTSFNSLKHDFDKKESIVRNLSNSLEKFSYENRIYRKILIYIEKRKNPYDGPIWEFSQNRKLKNFKNFIEQETSFNSKLYTKANPDVEQKFVDPLDHLIVYGLKEGRNLA